MSRNGAGTYTLPAGNPVVTGTTISSTWANNTLSDIATALTQSLAKDGQTTPTANIPLGGFKITGLGAPTTAGDALAYGSSLGAVTATTGTFSGNVQMASQNGGQLAGLRNYLINSGALVTQRAAQAFTNNMAAYGQVDRWAVSTAGFTTLSSSLARSGALGGSSSTTGYVVAFGATTTTGSGTITFYQRIESVNSVGLNGKTVTISGKLYQDTGSTISASVALYKPTAGVDNYTTSSLVGTALSVSVPTTANTSFSGQVTVGSADATNGLQLAITFPAGAVTAKYFQISDLQLEIGPVATPFEQRPYGMELALCQRYLPAWFVASGSSFGTGQCISATAAQITLNISVTPRVAPTGISASGVNTILTIAAGTTAGNASIAYASASVSTLFLNATGVSGLVAGNATQLLASGGAYTLYGTGCEL
jgi:hypothetical protein